MPVRGLRQRQRCRAPASLLPGRQPTPTAPSLERYAICRLATGDALPREAVPQQRIPRLGCQRKVSRLGLAGSFHLVDRRNPRAPTQPHPGTHAGWQRSVLPFLGRPSPATDTRPPRRESARSTADVRPLPDQWQSTRNRPGPSPCRPSLPWWEVPRALVDTLHADDPTTAIDNLLQWLRENHADLYFAYPERSLQLRARRLIAKAVAMDEIGGLLLNQLEKDLTP